MRVAWAGCGLSLPWRLCAPAPLRWAARRILADPAFAAAAGEVADWGRAHDGARRGAELVEALARSPAPSPARRGQLRGWDSNPQPSVNSRVLYRLSYPGTKRPGAVPDPRQFTGSGARSALDPLRVGDPLDQAPPARG